MNFKMTIAKTILDALAMLLLVFGESFTSPVYHVEQFTVGFGAPTVRACYLTYYSSVVFIHTLIRCSSEVNIGWPENPLCLN